MNKTGKNQHEWGVIAQAHNPYREFAYCPLCKQYQEAGKRGYMTKRFFESLVISLKKENPVYQTDSGILYEVKA